MTPHRMQKQEVEKVVDLISDIFGFEKQYSRQRMISALRRARDRRETLLISEDGRPVSHIRAVFSTVSVYGCEFKVASIGGVATDAAHRGRGYAGAILDTWLREMKEKGAKVLIVSGERGLYRRAHCVEAGRLYDAAVSREQAGPLVEGVRVRRVTLEDWPALAPLHQAEPVRLVRPGKLAGTLPFWWDCDSPELWLIERQREPVAYLGLSLGWPRNAATRRRVTWEYAGSRAALLDALPAVFAESSLDEITVTALGHDRELLYLIERRGWEKKERPLGGTHRLLDLPGLMKALKPYLRERLPRTDVRKLTFDQTGGRCTFAYGEERLEVGLSEAAPLVLGGPNAPPVEGELARVLAEVFPIPFPVPGFDYL